MKPDFLTRKLTLALGTFGLIVGTMNAASAQTFTPSQFPGGTAAVTQLPNATGSNYNPWASNVLKTLQNDRMKAIVVDVNGDFRDSLKLWKKAINKLLATQTFPENHYTLMYQIAARTLQIAESLEASAEQESKKYCPANDGACTRLYFEPIRALYEHNFKMIEQYHEFDETLYSKAMQNFRQSEGGSPASNTEVAFAIQLRAYTLDQLNWFKGAFTVQTGVNEIGAKYSNRTYYVVLNALLKGLIYDLGGDSTNPNPPLFVTAFAETANFMGDLSDQITSQLAGNTPYGNESDAFWSYNYLLNQIVDGLDKLSLDHDKQVPTAK